jgi:NAD(P)-dependent dehydrogenase (short-subunit alcohol dehydrogenase family)
MSNALIWGASGGIGSALVRELKAQGWNVYAAARNTANIPAEADETFTFDAAKPASFREVALWLAQSGVELQLVVYAAGAIIADKLDALGAANWQAVMDANLNGAYLGIESVLHLVPQGGHLMVIGAYGDKIGLPKFGAYAAAKAALEPMITVFAKENRRHHFTVIRLPAVNSAFWQNVPYKIPESALSPQAVAQAIVQYTQGNSGGELNL